MRPAVGESISCGRNVFVLENFNKNTFFSAWNGLTNGWPHVYKIINLVWTNFNRKWKGLIGTPARQSSKNTLAYSNKLQKIFNKNPN